MKKKKIYIAPDINGEIQKYEVLNLTSFRNQNRMKDFAEMMDISLDCSSVLLSNKKLDNIDIQFLTNMYQSDLRKIKHPIEEYDSSIISFQKIKEAIDNNYNIGIYGDYDGDGVTSSLILYETLKRFVKKDKLFLDFSRVGEDGFGFSKRGLQNLIEKKTKLIIVLDTGSNSEDTLKMAIDEDISVIVIDHHLIGKETNLIDNIIYVNPHLYEKETLRPEELRNAGLSWFYCRSFLKNMKEDDKFLYGFPLAISALGTIADAGSQFEGEYNRCLLHEGLQAETLSKVDVFEDVFLIPSYKMLEDISNENVSRGFRIMSLAKRTKNIIPDIVFEMFSLDTPKEKKKEIIAILNKEYEIFLDIADRATERILEQYNEESIIIEVAPKDIVPHTYIGMSGTLASRIMSRTQKPAIIFVQDEDNTLKGSWRTGDINGEELLSSINDINNSVIEQYGGHPPAGGILLSSFKKIHILRFMISDVFKKKNGTKKRFFQDDDSIIKIFATDFKEFRDFSFSLFEDMMLFSPFNRYDVKKPSFLLEDVYISDTKEDSFQIGSGKDFYWVENKSDFELFKGETVDLLLEFNIINDKSFSFETRFVINTDFILEG